MVKLLIANNADITSRTVCNDTALHYAGWRGHLPIIQWLVEHTAAALSLITSSGCGNENVKDWAETRGHHAVVQYLKAAPSLISSPGWYNMNVIEWAEDGDLHEIVEYLKAWSAGK